MRVLSLLSLMIQYFDAHHREAESKVIKDALTEDGIVYFLLIFLFIAFKLK